MARALLVALLTCGCASRVATPEPPPDPLVAGFRARAGADEIALFERLRASADEGDRTDAAQIVLFRLTDEELYGIGITQVAQPDGLEWAVLWSVSTEHDLGPVQAALDGAGLPCGGCGGLNYFAVYVPRELFFEARRALLASEDVRSRMAAGTVKVAEPRLRLGRPAPPPRPLPSFACRAIVAAMADKKIQAGDKLPDITLRRMTEKGPEAVKTSDFFKGRKVVVFAVPGAFTPTCHNDHLPSYAKNAATFKTKGVAEVACIAVNDPFVLQAWAKSVPGAEKLTFLSDGNGEFTKAIGMAFDGSGFGLGTRSNRYAMVVEDGRVKSIDVEEKPGACSISSGPSILKKI